MPSSPNANHRLDEHLRRALNKIKKPSTAEEITELMNHELEPGERPFRAEEVENSLREPNHKVVHLYWLAGRPRR